MAQVRLFGNDAVPATIKGSLLIDGEAVRLNWQGGFSKRLFHSVLKLFAESGDVLQSLLRTKSVCRFPKIGIASTGVPDSLRS